MVNQHFDMFDILYGLSDKMRRQMIRWAPERFCSISSPRGMGPESDPTMIDT